MAEVQALGGGKLAVYLGEGDSNPIAIVKGKGFEDLTVQQQRYLELLELVASKIHTSHQLKALATEDRVAVVEYMFEIEQLGRWFRKCVELSTLEVPEGITLKSSGRYAAAWAKSDSYQSALSKFNFSVNETRRMYGQVLQDLENFLQRLPVTGEEM